MEGALRPDGGELRSLTERVEHMTAIAEEGLAPVVPAAKDGFTREIRRVPLGVIFTIAPWNYPFLTAVNTIVPGLMAGNAVILKAASQTILTGERFQQALATARHMDDPRLLAHTLKRLGNWHMNVEQPDAAVIQLDEALRIFAALDDQRRRGSAGWRYRHRRRRRRPVPPGDR